MDPVAAMTLVQLGLGAMTSIAQLVAEIKAQSGMTDEQLLAWAKEKDAQTLQQIEKFLAAHRTLTASSSPAAMTAVSLPTPTAFSLPTSAALSDSDAQELRALSGSGGLAGAISGPDGHADE